MLNDLLAGPRELVHVIKGSGSDQSVLALNGFPCCVITGVPVDALQR
jgi:hypothetical protein